MHACTPTNTHVRAHSLTHMHKCTCICTRAHTYTHVHVGAQIHILASMHLQTQTQTHAHTHSYMCQCTCTHVHTHSHGRTPSHENTQEHTYANIPPRTCLLVHCPTPESPLKHDMQLQTTETWQSGGGRRTHLEVPVDDPHLVAVENRLQDLLDAVTAANSRRISAGGP